VSGPERRPGVKDAKNAWFSTSYAIANLPALAIDLHDARARYALDEILVRSPDAHLFDRGVLRPRSRRPWAPRPKHREGENGRTAAKIMSAPAAYRAAFCMPNSTYFEGKLRSAPPLPIPEGRPRAAPPRNKKQPWRVCHGNQWRVGAFEPSESEFRHGAISAHVRTEQGITAAVLCPTAQAPGVRRSNFAGSFRPDVFIASPWRIIGSIPTTPLSERTNTGVVAFWRL